MLLSVEYRDGVVHVHVDDRGRRSLIDALTRLRSGDHDHLMTPEWGGTELTADRQDENALLIHHVHVHCWEQA